MYLKRTIFHIEIVFCIVLSLTNNTVQNKGLRIIGGRDAAPGEFAYAAKMEYKVDQKDSVSFLHLCTCTLLKPTWSLTAGHCIEGFLKLSSQFPSLKGVIKYVSSNRGTSPYSNILSAFLHPNYYEHDLALRNFYNDIGLLLSETIAAFTFGKLSPVDYSTLYGSKVSVLGYGVTESANGTYGDAHSVNKPLQVLDVIINKCFNKGVFPSFCLGGLCGHTSSTSTCPGDSGGPIIHDTGVIGVVTGSIVQLCKAKIEPSSIKFKKFAGAMTPTSPYIDWVTNVIKSNSL